MDFVTPLYDVLKDQAVLDQAWATAADTYALSQQRMANVQMQNVNLQRQNNTMQALQQYLSGWSPDASLDPAPGDTPTQAARKNAMRMQQDAQYARGAAQAIARAGGDPKTVQQYMTEAINAGHWGAYAAREATQEQSKQADLIASIAGDAVKNADDAAVQQETYRRLAMLDPQLAQSLSFDTDVNGNITNGPNTLNTMRSLYSGGIKAKDQANLVIAAQNAATKAAAEKSREKVDDQRAAAAQAGVDLTKARTEAVKAGTAAGAKAGTKPLTPPQMRTNAEIDEARKEAANLSTEEIGKYYDNFSVESLRNPKILNVLQKAATRKYGDDPEYEDVRARLSPAAHQLGNPNAAPAAATPKTQSGAAPTGAPQEAVDYLKQHPELRGAFKTKYGYLPEGM